MLATIDPIALRLGPISIHWYAICIVSGLLLAVYLAQRWAPGNWPWKHLDFILLAFPIAIVGARLYYVIFQWSYYSQNPSEIFAIWNGGICHLWWLDCWCLCPLWFRNVMPLLSWIFLILQHLALWLLRVSVAGETLLTKEHGRAVSHLNLSRNLFASQCSLMGVIVFRPFFMKVSELSDRIYHYP